MAKRLLQIFIHIQYLLMLIDLLNSNGFVTFRFTSKSPNFAYRLKCFIAALV